MHGARAVATALYAETCGGVRATEAEQAADRGSNHRLVARHCRHARAGPYTYTYPTTFGFSPSTQLSNVIGLQSQQHILD